MSQCSVVCYKTNEDIVKQLWDSDKYDYIAYGISKSRSSTRLYLDFKQRTYKCALKKQLEALGITQIIIIDFTNDGGNLAASSWNDVREFGKREQSVWGEFGVCNPNLVKKAEEKRAEGEQHARDEIRRIAMEAEESEQAPTKKRGSEVQSAGNINKRARTSDPDPEPMDYARLWYHMSGQATRIAKMHTNQKEMHKDLDAGQKGIADGQKGIADGQKVIVDVQKKIVAEQKEMHKNLDAGQKNILNGQRELATELGARQAQIKRGDEKIDNQAEMLKIVNREKRALEKQLREKDVKLYEKDAQLREKDVKLYEKDAQLRAKDAQLAEAMNANRGIHRKLDILLARSQ
jgi:hypothetical protein